MLCMQTALAGAWQAMLIGAPRVQMLTACPASDSAQASLLASLWKPMDLAAPTAENRNSRLRQHPPNYNGLQRMQHRPLAPLSLSVLLAPMFGCCICISQGSLARDGIHTRCLLCSWPLTDCCRVLTGAGNI